MLSNFLIHSKIQNELESSRKKLKVVEENLKKDVQVIKHLGKMQFNNETMVGKSFSMNKIRRMINQVANVYATVLILGETGVGKELVANEIYNKSIRKDRPFIKINCSAIPVNLLESELFGYEKGSFTGANVEGKAGIFELANEGTLLLDEIGEMPLELQSKLLRVLQQKEIIRIGGNTPIKIDVRILAATNANIEGLVKQGIFRKDLYYRLNVFPIYVPPLRERIDDIEILANYFIGIFNKKYKKEIDINEISIEILKQYSWPGNIRELRNIIERMVIITETGNPISEDQLATTLNVDLYNDTNQIIRNKGLKEIIEDVERKYIKKALDEYGSTRKAAEVLKIDQSTVVKKAKKLGLRK